MPNFGYGTKVSPWQAADSKRERTMQRHMLSSWRLYAAITLLLNCTYNHKGFLGQPHYPAQVVAKTIDKQAPDYIDLRHRTDFRGRSSVVERRLPKPDVEGSNPFGRCLLENRPALQRSKAQKGCLNEQHCPQ